MKLRNPADAPFFLADINRVDLLESLKEGEEIDPELFEMFIKRRKPLIAGLVSFRKQQNTRQQWRSSRWKFLRGIRRYSRSLESKRMHRALGRFLSTRITRPHLGFLRDRYESLDTLKFDALKALSSYKTHMYIEEDYYSSLSEEAEYVSFMDYALPLLSSIELKIYHNSNAELDEDELELLYRLIDERELCKAFAEIFETIPVEYVIETYHGVQNRMMSDGSSQDETYFFSRLLENFIPCLVAEYEKSIKKETTNS